MGGWTTRVDYQISELKPEMTLLVLIGGNAWQHDDLRLTTLIQQCLHRKVIVGAICGAVDYLARNGLLTGYRHTGNTQFLWQSFSQYQNPTDFDPRQVVVDRQLVTANGTAALAFTSAVLKASGQLTTAAKQALDLKNWVITSIRDNTEIHLNRRGDKSWSEQQFSNMLKINMVSSQSTCGLSIRVMRS
ncbi:DJ-1/PfpI family protein [Levilactobacillus brevis]|nr:DJ-1/PfpI family protein [Levilactobacillus brevis]